MDRKKIIKKTIFENRWLIAASVFFIVWKLFLVGVIWHDRPSPPEPDDSYVYTEYIYSVKECPTLLCEYPSISFKKYTGFTYLSYRIFFGLISKIFNIDPVNLFHFSFYLGIILIVPILIFFLSCFTKDKKLIAFSLFFLALYSGSGSYHGFFWVVPSFFAVALFFLIFSILLAENKYWTIYLSFLVPTFIFMHDISFYAIFIFLFYLIAIFSINKKIDKTLLKKFAFIFLLTLASYMLMRATLSHFGNLNPRGIQKTFEAAAKNINALPFSKNIFENNALFEAFPALEEFKNSYLFWLFPNLAGILLFLIILFFVIKYRQYEIISLYFSALFFSLMSLVNTYGFRSLVILWPITFIFYAWGFWHILKFFFEKKFIFSKIAKLIPLTILLFFVALNLSYSYLFSKHINRQNNIKIENDFSSYLLRNTRKDASIFYDSKLIRSYALNTPLIEYKLSRYPNDADYVISYQETKEQLPETVSSVLPSILLGALSTSSLNIANPETKKELPTEFVLEKDFGKIKIYRHTK